MTIKHYIYNIRRRLREEPNIPELRAKLGYARAYERGEEGLTLYRSRAIAQLIGKRYTQDDQLAILFNKETAPMEYETYQAYRALCKSKVDADMAKMKVELMQELQVV